MLKLVGMRVAVGLLVLVAGCFSRASEGDVGDDGDPGLRTCIDDTDCVGAGPSCCGCPEYAVHRDTPYAQACEDLDCPLPSGCTGLAPSCSASNECVLACAEVTCELPPSEPCTGGLVRDAAGCLACECSPDPGMPQCTVASDCVRVPADCCGCAQGGADTGVPASEEQAHRDSLGCSGTPSCPGVDVCDPDAMVSCAGGVCSFGVAEITDLPPGACGPDLPDCPPGQMCVLNSDDAATLAGVGVCQ